MMDYQWGTDNASLAIGPLEGDSDAVSYATIFDGCDYGTYHFKTPEEMEDVAAALIEIAKTVQGRNALPILTEQTTKSDITE